MAHSKQRQREGAVGSCQENLGLCVRVLFLKQLQVKRQHHRLFQISRSDRKERSAHFWIWRRPLEQKTIDPYSRTGLVRKCTRLVDNWVVGLNDVTAVDRLTLAAARQFAPKSDAAERQVIKFTNRSLWTLARLSHKFTLIHAGLIRRHKGRSLKCAYLEPYSPTSF